MNANEFQTLEEYIKDKDNADKLNISFNGCDYYRYRVARLRKRAIRNYLVVGINKKYITIMSRIRVERAVV